MPNENSNSWLSFSESMYNRDMKTRSDPTVSSVATDTAECGVICLAWWLSTRDTYAERCAFCIHKFEFRRLLMQLGTCHDSHAYICFI